MKTIKTGLIAMLALLGSVTAQAQQLAFPGAQGWGRTAVGGRSGSVYHVTNLNDSGTGSLRDAVSQPGRIVVFDVAGVININSRIVFSHNLYVAGQTAPGEGVTVYGNGVSFSGSNNIIVRYMRFRMGKGGDSGKDCAGISNGTNMIFDHCSFSWGLDEVFSINPDGKGDLHNITLMNCVFGQGLLTHSAGGLMQADSITLYRNFYCDNGTRNNKVKGAHQYVNNIVYNWKNGCYLMGGDSQGKSYANTQGNLFINGPAGGGNACTSGNSDFNIYASDNWQDKNRDGVLNPYEIPKSEYGGGPTFRTTPYPYPELDIVGATTLIDEVLPTVGASLPYRDYADCYMVDECLSFGQDGVLISTEDVLPFGKPSTWSVWGGNGRVDTDGDGMPDWWENANGTNPNANDAMQKAANGYVNIENYINSISADTVEPFLRAPQLVAQADATPSSITIEWRDWTVGEDGFIVEVERDGSFVEVGRTAAGATTYTITEGLEAGKSYRVRVCAYKGDDKSALTVAQVKTMQEQVEMVDVDNYVPDFTWKGGDHTWDNTTDAWVEGLYADGGKVLFPMEANATVTLAQTVAPAAIVVKGTADLKIFGSGKITGAGSVNKAGTGKMTLGTNNDYTGATVLRGGEMSIASLKDGGQPSSIGASLDYAQNWVWYGGTWKYIGSNTSTNRSATIYKDTEFNIQNNVTVSMGGKMEGEAGLILDGKGTLAPTTKDFFSYSGPTIVKGGLLKLNGVSKLWTDKICKLGSTSKLVLAGGEFRTQDSNDTYATYDFPIEVVADTYSKVYFCRNCSINNKVTGTGVLEWEANWLREYINGDWSGFYGTLVVNGTGSDSQLMLNNNSHKGLPNTSVYLKGNARILYWPTNGELYLGGLGGDAGTFLSGSSKNTAGHKMTWHVGGADTDEVFAGVIDDCASSTASKYNGVTTIIKEGEGSWCLTGTNVYSGTTTVNGGSLIVNGRINGTGAVAVNADATLAGMGTIAGAVTIKEGGKIQPGVDEQIGTGLTLSRALTINKGGIVNIHANRETCNTLVVKANVTLAEGAVLQVAEGKFEEAPYKDTAFKVFDATGTITGTFSEIIPATPGEGQTWDVSELYSAGIIKVVGGEQNPNVEPGPGPDDDKVEKSALLTWGNMSTASYDDSGVNNMLVGTAGDDAEGFSMVVTGNLTKYYSAADKINVEYNGNTLNRTTIKCSNGAENTIFLPEDAKATKITLWSYTNVSTPNRTSYWVSVGGKEYTQEESVILQETKDTSNPSRASFDLDDLQHTITFRNTGEQQCVIVAIDYYTGGTNGVSTINSSGKPAKVEYYTPSGERVATPSTGLYMMRVTMTDGKTVTRKVVF